MEITEANFEAEVVVRSNQVPVVVVLWSPRSDASVQLADVLASLAAEDGGKWSLVSVNVDTAPRVAQIFGVQAVPTVVALAAGQPLSSFQGLQPPDQLRGWVDSLLNATAGKLGDAGESDEPEQVDPELAQARAHLDKGDFDAALSAYQEILDANPNHEEAKGAVRQMRSWPGRPRGRQRRSPRPTPVPTTSRPCSQRRTSRSSSRTSRRRSTG